jgi:hypothetical protein
VLLPVLSRLAAADPNAAVQWASTLLEVGDRRVGLETVLLAAVEGNPAAHLPWAAERAPEFLTDEALARSVAAWNRSDPAALRTWLVGGCPPGLRQRAWAGLQRQ